MAVTVSVGLIARELKPLAAALVRSLFLHAGKPGAHDLSVHVWDLQPADPVGKYLEKELAGTAEFDQKITIVNQEGPENWCEAHNRMVRATRSQYHVVIAEGVWVGPEWLARTLAHFDARTAVVGAWPHLGRLADDFSPVPADGANYDYVESWYMVWSRLALDRHNLFDSESLEVPTGEDADACLRYRACGWTVKAATDLPVWKVRGPHHEHAMMGVHNLPLLARRWAQYLRGGRSFPRHAVVLPAEASRQEEAKLRWQFPFSDVVVEAVPEAENRYGDKSWT